ncbi:hypothetical protein [Desulfosporosinus fructosivorans]
MSLFTVVIIIWGIYQLVVAVSKKKGPQQSLGKLSDSFKLPDGSTIRDAIQGIQGSTWREQLKQAMQAGTLQPTVPLDVKKAEEYYVETEGTQGIEGIQGTEGSQGIEGTQGTEGTSEYVGILGLEAYKSADEIPGEEITTNSIGLSGVSVTELDLVQGVIWAEILGKPRAMHPFRGPRI